MHEEPVKDVNKIIEEARRGIEFTKLGSFDRAITPALKPLLRKVGDMYVAFNTKLAEEISKGRESDIDRIWNYGIRRVRKDSRYETVNGDRREVTYAGMSFELFITGESEYPNLADNARLVGAVLKQGLLDKGGEATKAPDVADGMISANRRLWYQEIHDINPIPALPIKHFVLVRLEPQQAKP